MPLPGQTFSLVDPGVGTVGKATNVPLVIGICSAGNSAVLETYTNPADLVSDHGQGPAVEAACNLLNYVPMIRFCRVAQGSAGSLGSVTKSGSGPNISDNSSTPYDRYELKIQITTGGALGTARFRYSLDGGRTYSGVIVLPSGGAVTIANTGIALTAASGTYVAGDTYTATTAAPTFTSTQLDLSKAGIDASPFQFDWMLVAGKYADASTANTIAGVISGYLTDWWSKFRFVAAFMDAGADVAATTISSFTTENRALLGCYGDCDVVTRKPMVGWSQPLQPVYIPITGRAAKALLSSSLGRYADGIVDGIASYDTIFGSPVTHDEQLAEGMDEARFVTLRSYRGETPGRYFITRGKTRAPVTSDLSEWDSLRIACVAQTIISQKQRAFINKSWRTNPDGTVDEGEAAAAEAMIQAALEEVLLKPKNAEGTQGHVSAVRYQIDRGTNLNTTKTLSTSWAVRARGKSEFIETSGGFTLNI